MVLLRSKLSQWLEENKNKLLIILCAIFLVKGVFYAMLLMPRTMGVSPDDVGHFSYIQYIATQGRLPIHGVTFLEKNALDAYINYYNFGDVIDYYITDVNFFPEGEHLNWIAQHPPLYYIIMAVIYNVVTLFTSVFSTTVVALRVFNLFFGVASLIFMSKILDELNAKDIVRKCVLLFFTFSPAIQFYFSAITNDSMLIFICIFALYYLLKYMRTKSVKHFIVFVIGSALIVGTKYNGFMVMFSYIGFFAYYSFRYNGFKTTLKLACIGVPIGLAIILPDLIFTYVTTGRVFGNDAGLIRNIGVQLPHNYGLGHFLFETQYIPEMTRNLLLLIGWAHWVYPNELIVYLYGGILFALVIINFIKCKNRVYACAVLVLGCIVFVIFRYFIEVRITIGIAVCVGSAAALLLYSIHSAITSESKSRMIQLFFIVTIVFTVAIYVNTHYGIFRYHGIMRALHGRYYYILFFPFAYMFFHKLGDVKLKLAKFAPLALAIVLIAAEANAIMRAVDAW